MLTESTMTSMVDEADGLRDCWPQKGLARRSRNQAKSTGFFTTDQTRMGTDNNCFQNHPCNQ
jgi:hypothetical protein